VKNLKLSSLKPMFAIGVVIFLIILVAITIFISKEIISDSHEATLTMKNIQIAELESDLKDYHEQSLAFLEKQSEIRSYVNELVELLYARESYLGIGGAGQNIELNEQTPLFQLKQAIQDLNDDEQAMKMVRNYLVSRRNFAESFPFIWPVPGGVPRVSSGYGVRANEEVGSVLGDRPSDGIHFHAGIDIPGSLGDNIQATADGRVVWVQHANPVYGKVVVIQHDYGFQTLYGHMTDLNVKIGQYIKRGDIIGHMGDTGASYGVHLHYEIKKDGVHIDPMNLLSMNM
jgi:murein DD-endopeptidase MepM/ murein hydrolase activator NlpD